MRRSNYGTRLRGVGRVGTALVAGAVLAAGLSSTSTVTAFAAKPSTVEVAKAKGVGKVLADAKGRTLYTLTNAGQAVPCSGACATQWPPLRATAGSVKGARGVTGLGVDSTLEQVTHDGLPLYRFAGDTKPGQAAGESIQSFGGVWHVAPAGAAPVSVEKSRPTKSTGSYGY